MGVAPRLSICIPTHHGRATTLEEAIDSVRDQASGHEAPIIEICVSDNASADGTAELMDRLSGNSEIPVRYSRNQTDLGPAQNTLRAVEMARGEYCWILSSDDLLAAGAIGRVLELLDQHPSVSGLTVDQVVFSPSDGSELPRGWYDIRPAGGEARLLTEAGAILEELGLLFSGISLHVFDRQAWTRLADQHREEILGGHGLFAHAVILARLAGEAPRWVWCPEPLVRYRSVAGAAAGLDMTTWLPRFVDDLCRVLRPHLADAAYRRVTRRLGGRLCRPDTILLLRRQRGFGLREDLLLAGVLFRRLRWIDGFWSETVPALLIPRFAARVPSKLAGASREAMRLYCRLVRRGPFRARLTAGPQRRVAADTVECLRVRIENRGLPLRTWWPWLPLYVSCRWRRNGSEVDNPAILPARVDPVIRRGRQRDVLLRTPTPPESGRYELIVGLVWNGIWLDELACAQEVEVALQGAARRA
jgi:abequosyltransferase